MEDRGRRISIQGQGLRVGDLGLEDSLRVMVGDEQKDQIRVGVRVMDMSRRVSI